MISSFIYCGHFRKTKQIKPIFYKKINLYDVLPLKDIIITRIFYHNNKGFSIIKENNKSIPGFTYEGCFKVIDIKNEFK